MLWRTTNNVVDDDHHHHYHDSMSKLNKTSIETLVMFVVYMCVFQSASNYAANIWIVSIRCLRRRRQMSVVLF